MKPIRIETLQRGLCARIREALDVMRMSRCLLLIV
jgi:hypothetical protein